MEKGLETEKVTKIEIKLEKLKISKTIVDPIKKSVISEKRCFNFQDIEDIVFNRRHKV